MKITNYPVADHFLAGGLLMLAAGASLNGQVHSNAAALIHAEGKTPDKVATHLMPVPIFNFAIHNVAFHPDGQTLATGDGNGLVRLWETKTGRLRHSIPAHTNWAFSIAWSRDGKFLATGGGDNLVHWFDAAKPGQPLKTFTGHSGDVHAVIIAPDSRSIFSAGDDKRIIAWDARRGASKRDWTAHSLQIPTLALSPDGKILASGSRDDSIRLWNTRSGRGRDTLIGHHDDVMSVRFSPDGKTLASASYDQTVRLWEVATGKAVRIFQGHTNRVFSVAFSPDGKRLVSAGDSTVQVWDVASGTVLNVISLGGVISSAKGKVPENLSSVAFSPDGNSLAVASTTGLAFLLTQSGEVLWTLSQPGLK